MKKSILLLIISATVFVMACDKDDDNAVPSITGFWKGYYSNSPGGNQTAEYAFLFRADGTVRVFDGYDTTTATGSWAEGLYNITGNTVRTYYSYGPGLSYSTSGTLTNNATKITGTWGDGNSASGSGDFNVTKQ